MIHLPTRSRARDAARSVVALALFTTAVATQGVAGQESQPVVYEADNVRVVQLTATGGDLVAAHLYLLGGAQQLTSGTAGIERLILLASRRGTEGFPGDAVVEAQVSTGSRFFVRTTPDWSVLGFTGLAEEFDRSWAVLADRVMRPSLDPAEVEIVRNQALVSVRAANDDPDGRVQLLAERLAFAGHAYSVDTFGTEETLSGLTSDHLRAYHDDQFVRSRMLLSVVGSVDRSVVESAIRSTLASLPLGSYSWTLPPRWAGFAPDIVVEERALPTNYILGYFGGPTTAGEDYPAFQVAVIALSGFISSRVRERGLSYAGGARFVDRAAAGGGIYVSTVDPEESLKIVNEGITSFSEGTIPRYLLRDYAESTALDYYLSNQTHSQQADFLAESLLLRGQLTTVRSWVEALRGVSGNQIRQIFRRYIRNIQYAFLGSPRAVPREQMLRN